MQKLELKSFLLIIAMFMLAVPSCGGGGGSSGSDSAQSMDGLPPAINDVQANQSVRGVDTDGDGVRDDLEHEIFNAAPSNSAEDILARKVYYRWVEIVNNMLTIYEEHNSSSEEVLADATAANEMFENKKELELIYNSLDEGLVKEIIPGFDSYINYGYPDRILARGGVSEVLDTASMSFPTLEETQEYLFNL